jgi:hypothetical protein
MSRITLRGDMEGALAKPSRQTMSRTSDRDGIVRTSGEIFADGSMIELVSSATDNQLDLLFWHKHRKIIAPQIDYRDRVYQAPDVNDTLRRAIRLPTHAADYGTTKKFFAEIRILFERYVGLTLLESSLMSAWVCSTWFPDCASSPPTLMLSGSEIGAAITFFRLLSCLCRRSLILADVNRTGFLSLMPLQPTLLISQPSGSLKMLNLWETSNYRGVHVVGSGGKVHNVAGSKAIFLGMAETSNTDAIHLALRGQHPLPPLDEHSQAEIANRLLPQLLMYRLCNFRRIRESCCDVRKANFPNGELAHNLTTCIQGEPEIAQAIASILQRQDQDAQGQRGCDVNLAILEVIWAPLHDTKEIAVNRIAEWTNALLRCRGEVLEYSAVEIGWRLKNLGLYRHRNGAGMVLRFSGEHCRIVHQLTRRFALSLSLVTDCPNCVQPEDIVAQ